MLQKKIKIKEQRHFIANDIVKKMECSVILARVLAARGFVADDNLASFLNPTLRTGLLHPDKMKNLRQASLVVKDKIDHGFKVAICCDFDVDGLSGGGLLYQFLLDCGFDTRVFVPDRFTEGYGLNKRIVDEVIEAGFGLLIAVDFGSTNLVEVVYAKEKGLSMVVIDHHHIGDALPQADSFINPEQEGCGFKNEKLCAAGLAWYFVCALKDVLQQAKNLDMRDYLEFACLGTICDMVPLLGVNRVIARKGLEKLNETQRAGFKALLNVSGVKKSVSCTDVSFGVGPRINAAGRMASGDIVIELLTTKDSKRADTLAHRLERLNAERQDLEKKFKLEAVRRIARMYKIPYGIVISDKDFHTGVIGIVAQRLAEMYYRPTAVIGCDNNGVYKGSCRGIKGFNVVEALERVSDILLGFGGHVGAGGFSLEEKNISAFSLAFNDEAARQLAAIETIPFVEADTVVELADLTTKLVDELASMAPYGIGNPAPVLLLKNLHVVDVMILRSTHLKALVSDGKRTLPAWLWNQTEHPALQRGALINLACRPQLNTFNGLLEIQLQVQAAELIS